MAVVTPVEAPAAGACIEVATRIGRRIVADAIWHERRCSWVGAMPEEGPGGGVAITYQALGPDLYGGTAGVGLFLAELARATGDADARRTALGSLRHAASRAASLPDEAPGLYAGRPGSTLALAYAAAVLDEDELADAAATVVASAPGPDPGGEFDLVSGHAGAVIGLLAVRSLLGDDGLLDRARAHGDALLASADPQDHGLGWQAPQPLGSRPLTGFSHGAAGVAAALLELGAATGDGRYTDAATEAFGYERSLYDPSVRNWPDLREDPRRMPGAPTTFATFWCHGAPGIALSRLRALELGDGSVREEARTALATTAAWVEQALGAGVNYSLCHGLAGNAEIVGEGTDVLGAAARDTVAAVAQAGIESYHERDAPWPSGAHGGSTPALFLGDGGIGRFYLRLADPTLPSLLLPRPEAFAAAPVGRPEAREEA